VGKIRRAINLGWVTWLIGVGVGGVGVWCGVWGGVVFALGRRLECLKIWEIFDLKFWCRFALLG
jgi:hypothetical protein